MLLLIIHVHHFLFNIHFKIKIVSSFLFASGPERVNVC